MISFQLKRYHLLIVVVLARILFFPVSSSCQTETKISEFLSVEEITKELHLWFESPLKLIMTPEEESILRKLKTLEEKIQFIRIFWARRDPNPETGINEFREEFYRRVDYAKVNFGRGGEDGWKTAQGEIYIVFGPPDWMDMQYQDISGRMLLTIIWYYYKSPSIYISPGEPLVFAEIFIPGEYYLLNSSFTGARPSRAHRLRSEKILSEFRPALRDANERASFNKELTYDQILSPTPSAPPTTPQLTTQQIPFKWKVEYTTLPEEKVKVLLTLMFKYRDLSWYKEESDLKVQLITQVKLADQEGEVIDQRTDTIVLRLTADQLMEKRDAEYHYQVNLMGRPGQHLLEIIVKDNLSGVVNQLKVAINIPPILSEGI